MEQTAPQATPRPWTIRRENGYRYLDGADGVSLMSDTTYYPWVPDKEADWQFIVQACNHYEELVEALRTLVEGSSLVGVMNGPNVLALLSEANQDARAVLAKIDAAKQEAVK